MSNQRAVGPITGLLTVGIIAGLFVLSILGIAFTSQRRRRARARALQLIQLNHPRQPISRTRPSLWEIWIALRKHAGANEDEIWEHEQLESKWEDIQPLSVSLLEEDAFIAHSFRFNHSTIRSSDQPTHISHTNRNAIPFVHLLSKPSQPSKIPTPIAKPVATDRHLEVTVVVMMPSRNRELEYMIGSCRATYSSLLTL